MKKSILFGDIIVMGNKKQKTIRNAVFLLDDKIYKGNEIIKIISCKKVGETNINKEYTEVKASNEKRNNITGAYE